MTEVLKEAWGRWPVQIVAFAAMCGFAWLTAPELTWINTDSDSGIYLASAKYLIPSHPTGAPFYNVMNAVWLRAFPFGSEAWRIALGSAIFSGATAGLLYKETRSLIAPLIYGGSAVVVSQSTILETYALVTFCMVGMYVYRGKPKAVVIFAFVGLGVHHLIGLVLIPMMVSYYLGGRSLKPFAWLLLAPLMYLYIPLTLNPESAWLDEITFSSMQDYFSGQGGLILGIAVVEEGPILSADMLQRFTDFGIFFFGGFLAAIVPIFMRRKHDLLLWVFLLPILHYGFGLPDLAWVYLMPSFAFGAVMASEALEQQSKRARSLKIAVAGFAGIAIAWNLIAFDIGKNLDPNLSAQAYYDQLDELPDDAFVYSGVRGWEDIVIVLHNLDSKKNIHYEDRRYVVQSPEVIRDQIASAAYHRRLFASELIDAETYEVKLRRVDPWEIWLPIMKNLYKVDPVPEHLRAFRWSDTVYGKGGLHYLPPFESVPIPPS